MRLAHQIRRSDPIRLITHAALLVAALAIGPSPAMADDVVIPPPVPGDLHVEEGNRAFLIGHAVGTQNYSCLPSGSGVMWTLFGPQATLFDDEGEQITTHFLSPNPDENGTLRATWQHSRDTSSVWAVAVAISSDPSFVAPGAIPWLLLRVVGAEAGPTWGDRLTRTTFIHRVNTAGGVAPSTGCSVATDIGKRVFVGYTADYVFYRASRRD